MTPVESGDVDPEASEGNEGADRAPEVTRAVTRGVARQFEDLGWAVVAEVALANGRRADLIALGDNGTIRIVEVKSGLPDFLSDQITERADQGECAPLVGRVGPVDPGLGRQLVAVQIGVEIDRPGRGGEDLRTHLLGDRDRVGLDLAVGVVGADSQEQPLFAGDQHGLDFAGTLGAQNLDTLGLGQLLGRDPVEQRHRARPRNPDRRQFLDMVVDGRAIAAGPSRHYTGRHRHRQWPVRRLELQYALRHLSLPPPLPFMGELRRYRRDRRCKAAVSASLSAYENACDRRSAGLGCTMDSPPPEPRGAPPNLRRDALRAILFMTLAINLFPFMNVAAKFLSESYPTGQVVWARYAGHLIFVLVMFMPRRGLSLLKASRPGIHVARSVLMFLSTICFFSALRWIDVPTASSINFTSPLIVTALAAPILGEMVGLRRWTAVAFGFAGALIIIRPGGAETHWAMLLVLGTAFSYATYQIVTRKFAAADPPETSITYISFVGALLSTLALPFFFVWPTSILDTALFALLGFIGGLGHYFVIRAFQLGEASVLAPFNYGQLLMAIALSYLVFGTFPDLWTFVGAGIIVASGLYITYRESGPRSPPSS